MVGVASKVCPKGAKEVSQWTQMSVKGAQKEPKGWPREPKAGQREPKGCHKEPKVSQRATQMHQQVALRKKIVKMVAAPGIPRIMLGAIFH